MTISSQLGYPTDDLEPVLETTRALQANSLMTQLAAIDAALSVSTLDSMAVEVGDLKVNYTRNIQLMKLEGSRLLKQLANLSGLPVLYDRFLPPQPNPWSVQSYW